MSTGRSPAVPSPPWKSFTAYESCRTIMMNLGPLAAAALLALPCAASDRPAAPTMDLRAFTGMMKAQARHWQAQAADPRAIDPPGPLAGRSFESMRHFHRSEIPGPCLELSDGFGWRHACLLQRHGQTRLVILVLTHANSWLVSSDQAVVPPAGTQFIGSSPRRSCRVDGHDLPQGFGFARPAAGVYRAVAADTPTFWFLAPRDQLVPVKTDKVECDE